MITIVVFTTSGKSQEFLVKEDKLIYDIKMQIIKNHKHITNFGIDNEIKLLYKGVELDESKTISDYQVKDKASFQIIFKTNPLSIRRLSESAPTTSFFENYAPSPLDSYMDSKRYSKSSSPNFPIEQQTQSDISKQFNSVNNTLELILERLTKLETRVNTIYDTVVTLNKK
jgi:hypothetical protein